MTRLLIVFLFLSSNVYGQFKRSDSLGNFYVIERKLVWEKYYEYDSKEELDEMLKADPFTSELNIMGYTNSVMIKSYKLNATNLPEYAQHSYEAFLAVDFLNGRFRVRLQQIFFPDFEEKHYYNGVRQHNSRGTLEQYILRTDGQIKRNSAAMHVLNSFDSAFSEIFDPMGYSYE